MKHSISFQKNINEDKVKMSYRAVVSATLDQAEMASYVSRSSFAHSLTARRIPPFKRTY